MGSGCDLTRFTNVYTCLLYTSLESQIREYASGKAIEAPIYDFAQHLRVSDRFEHVPAKSLLIVEGILALHFAELRPLFDLSIYLEAPDGVCFHRRKVRDITERQRSLDLSLIHICRC